MKGTFINYKKPRPFEDIELETDRRLGYCTIFFDVYKPILDQLPEEITNYFSSPLRERLRLQDFVSEEELLEIAKANGVEVSSEDLNAMKEEAVRESENYYDNMNYPKDYPSRLRFIEVEIEGNDRKDLVEEFKRVYWG